MILRARTIFNLYLKNHTCIHLLSFIKHLMMCKLTDNSNILFTRFCLSKELWYYVEKYNTEVKAKNSVKMKLQPRLMKNIHLDITFESVGKVYFRRSRHQLFSSRS